MAQTTKATAVRSRRAALRRMIKEGRVDGLEVLAGGLDEWEETAGGMTLRDVLDSVPDLDELAAVRLIARIGVPPGARLYALTPDRRREIAGEAKKEIKS